MISHSDLEEVRTLGNAIYTEQLQAKLEPKYNNQYVALHVDSGDYSVAKSTGVATRDLLKRHAVDGRIYLRRIGNEPEYALASRILSGEMQAEL